MLTAQNQQESLFVSGSKSGQCSVIKWIYQISYEGTLLNKESDWECGNLLGILVRYNDYLTITKVAEKRNGFVFD